MALNKRDIAHVIERLSGGTVPERGLEALAVGIERERGELHRQLERTFSTEGRRIEITTVPQREVYADGEPVCKTPVVFEIIPQAIKQLTMLKDTGNWFTKTFIPALTWFITLIRPRVWSMIFSCSPVLTRSKSRCASAGRTRSAWRPAEIWF